jgi:hypothetical protein
LVGEVLLALELKGVVHVTYERRWVAKALPDTDRPQFERLESLVLAGPESVEYRADTPAPSEASRSFERHRCGGVVGVAVSLQGHDPEEASDQLYAHSISSFGQSPACSALACAASPLVRIGFAVQPVALVGVVLPCFERREGVR